MEVMEEEVEVVVVAEEEVEVEEEEERKSLVSSTHLTSSEYSVGIGKAIQSDGCSLPP